MARDILKHMRGWPSLLVLVLLIVIGGVASATWVFTAPVVVSEKIMTALPTTSMIWSPVDERPDEDDDPQPLQPPLFPPKWPCAFDFVGAKSFGDGMHVAVASGNVYTRVPVLEILGPRGTTLEVTLYYDSLRSHEDRGCGYGWSHSLLHTWYLVPGQQGEPDKIVIVDGTGRRRAHADINGNYFRPPSADGYIMHVEQHYLTVHADTGETYQFSNYELSSITSPQGLVTTFTYDQSHRLETVTDGYGRQVQFAYNATHGQLETITDPASNSTTLTYDPTDPGLLVGVEDPEGEETTFQYEVVTRGSDTLHRMTCETLKNGEYFTCEYDDTTGAMSRTIKSSSVPPQTIVSVASEEFVMVRGQQIDDTATVTVTDDRGEVWEYERDAWWHLTKMIPPGAVTEFATAVYGDDLTNEPETFAQLISTTDTLGYTRYLTYDENGIIESVTDRLGYTTTYAYEHEWDHDNDDGASTPAIPMPAYLTEKVLPGAAQPTWNYVYDGYRCDLTEIWDPIHEDGQDLIATIDYTYYDETNPYLPGRLELVVQTDRNGYTTTYEFGTDGKLNTRTVEVETGTPAVEIVSTYAFDSLGRMTSETIDMGEDDDIITHYTYDKMGRLTDVVRDPYGLGLTASYTYDGHGLLLTTTDPKGTVTAYTYDHRNRLETITEDAGTGRLNLLTQYAYATNGTVTVIDPRGNSTQYEYDPRGRLERTLDAEGYETLYDHDFGGNLLEIDRGRAPGTGGERDLRSFIYDPLGRVLHADTGDTSVGYQLRQSYLYPGTNCGCGGIGGSTPSSESIGYPATSVEQVSRDFDIMGRVEYVYQNFGGGYVPSVAVTQYEYDPVGNVTYVWGPQGEETEFTYDGAGRLLTRRVLASEDGDPPVETWLETSFTYDPAGNLRTITLPNGHTLTGTYDTANRLLNVTEMDGQTPKTLVVYTYDDNGNVLTRTDGVNDTWTYMYDALNRLVSEYDPADEVTEFEYDEASNLVAMFDRKGICTRLFYDDLNRAIQKTEHAPTLIQPLAMGGLLDPITPTLSTKTYFEYDGSRLIEIRDHDGNETTYDFNDWGLLEKITYPDAGDVDFEYSDWGLPYQRIDQRGITTTYTFDVQGQLRQRSYSNSDPDVRFNYDGSGRLTEAYVDGGLNGDLLVFTREHDLAGRLTGEELNISRVNPEDPPDYVTGVAYSINPTTHVADWTLTTPASRQVVHQVDRLNRLFSAHDANNASIGVDWTFDDASRRSTMFYRNDANLGKSHTYDDNGRVTELDLTYTYPGGTVTLWGEHYGYDAEGNRIYTERVHEPGRSEVYSYDSRHRLRHMYRGTLAGNKQSVQTPLVDTRLASHEHWRDLDRRGNWLDYRATLNGTDSMQARTATTVNEYGTFDIDGPSLPEPQVVLGYDDAGNLTGDPSAPNWGDTSAPSGQEYVYDGENRLIEVIRASDDETLIEYEYDALGRRVHTIEYYDTDGDELSPPRVTRHVYFGLEVIEEYSITNLWQYNEAHTLAREFIWGSTARFPEPVVMIDHTDAGNVSGGTAEVLHYVHDVLGSVVALIDEYGEIVERYTYDPYGKTFIEKIDVCAYPASVIPVATSQFDNPFRWTGQRYDEAVGLYSFFFRLYTPRHGRWLQRDPAGYAEGINLYEYAAARPMISVDPLGLCSLLPKITLTWDPVPKKQRIGSGLITSEVTETAKALLDAKVALLFHRLATICLSDYGTSDPVGLASCLSEALAISVQIRHQLWMRQWAVLSAQFWGERYKTYSHLLAHCTRWPKRLRWILNGLDLEYFHFDAIQLWRHKNSRDGGHCAFGIKGKKRKGTTVKPGEGKDSPSDGEYEQWDWVLDMTDFNRRNYDGDLIMIDGSQQTFYGEGDVHGTNIFGPYGPPLRPDGREVDPYDPADPSGGPNPKLFPKPLPSG